jgi:hypothetical protein
MTEKEKKDLIELAKAMTHVLRMIQRILEK